MAMTRLLVGIGAGILSIAAAVVTNRQDPAPLKLSEELRGHLKEAKFQAVTSLRGLPLGVRYALQDLFGTQELDIADPKAEFQANGVVGASKLPIRRLVLAGCSIDHCLIYYERGGSARTWRVALFHWVPADTRLELGGIAPFGLTSIDDVRDTILSGAIKGPTKIW